ncbi:MAG: hypothetical protein ABI664_23985 [bacterium]
MDEADIIRYRTLLESYGRVSIQVDSYISSHAVLSLAIYPGSTRAVYGVLTGCAFLQGNLFVHRNTGTGTTLSLERHSDHEVSLVGEDFAQVGSYFALLDAKPERPVDVATTTRLLSEIAATIEKLTADGMPANAAQELLRGLAHVAEVLAEPRADDGQEILETISRFVSKYPVLEPARVIAAGLSNRTGGLKPFGP